MDRRGQLVRTNDFYGTVEHIDLRNTNVHTLTGQIIPLPNKDVFQHPLENFSASGYRRIDILVTVPTGLDLGRAGRLAIAAVETVKGRDPSRSVEVFYEGFVGTRSRSRCTAGSRFTTARRSSSSRVATR